MTIDKQKLKALAEAANAVTTDVNITMAVGADPVEIKAVQDYLQVAMPKTILALLAEIELLEASDSESTELCDCLSSLLGQVAVTVRGPEEPKSRHGFSDIPSRVKAVVAERDQLKAAISSPDAVYLNMKSGVITKPKPRSMVDLYGEVVNGEDAQLLEIARLRAENEALRSALGDCADELAAEIICKNGGLKPEDMHPVTRRLYERDMAAVLAARAAMAKEASHG